LEAKRVVRIVSGVAVGALIGLCVSDRMVFFVLLPIIVVALFVCQVILIKRQRAIHESAAEYLHRFPRSSRGR
jgi:predicted MFS family arabinose efflux permease